jgi:hypothetical protein
MCLETIQIEPEVAEKPITVYKVLNNCGGVYYTPYQGKVVWNEILDGKEPLVAEGEKNITTITSINGGYIHTYKNFSSIKELPYYSVFECEIPAGTKYWANENSYASEQIVFKKLAFEHVHGGDWTGQIKEAAKLGELTDENRDIIYGFWGRIYMDAFSNDADMLYTVFQNIAIQFVNNNWEKFIFETNQRTPVNYFDAEKLLRYADAIVTETQDVNLASDISMIWKTVQDIYNAAKENDIWKGSINSDTKCWHAILGVIAEVITKNRDKELDERLERNINDYKGMLKTAEDRYNDRNRLFSVLLPD